MWRVGVVEVTQYGIDKRLVAPKDGYLRGLSAERVKAVGLALRNHLATNGKIELGIGSGAFAHLIDIILSHNVRSRRGTNEHIAHNGSDTVRGRGRGSLSHINALACNTREDDALASSNSAIDDLFDNEALLVVGTQPPSLGGLCSHRDGNRR